MQSSPTCLRCSSDKVITIVTRRGSDRGLGPLRWSRRMKKVSGHGYDPHPFLYAARGRALAVTPDQLWVRLDPQGALYSAPVKVFSPASCGSSASLKLCWIRDRSPHRKVSSPRCNGPGVYSLGLQDKRVSGRSALYSSRSADRSSSPGRG